MSRCQVLPPCLFKLYAEYIMWNAGLEESQAGINIAGRNISNLRCADDTTQMAEREEELTSLLMSVKEESGKAGLKFNVQKTKIMASGPITSWQIDGETVIDFIFGGLLKSRGISLSTKVCLDKAMVFPVVMYGCESWTIKKAEIQSIDAFELWS